MTTDEQVRAAALGMVGQVLDVRITRESDPAQINLVFDRMERLVAVCLGAERAQRGQRGPVATVRETRPAALPAPTEKGLVRHG